jgi:hypothetical protein
MVNDIGGRETEKRQRNGDFHAVAANSDRLGRGGRIEEHHVHCKPGQQTPVKGMACTLLFCDAVVCMEGDE